MNRSSLFRLGALSVHVRARGTRLSGSVSGACRSGSCSPRPSSLRSTDLRRRMPARVRAVLRYYGRGLTSRGRASSATAPRLPDADHTAPAEWPSHEISRFPRKERAYMPGSQTTRGQSGGSRWRVRPCCLPLSRRRRHPEADFRGSMAGLCAPLSTLRRTPRGVPAHDLGSVWVATPSPCRTFTAYSLPVSRRTETACCARLLSMT